MSEVSSIQWFPGHMAKTRRLMQKNISLVDAVVEITDARIPQSSRNPEMDRLVGQKPRLIILNNSIFLIRIPNISRCVMNKLRIVIYNSVNKVFLHPNLHINAYHQFKVIKREMLN